MKSDMIRFEILKILSQYHTHGYEIYEILSSMDFVKTSAQVYKYLGALKESGLIQTLRLENIEGHDREILQITNKGEIFFRQGLIEILLKHKDIISNLVLGKIGYPIYVELLKSFPDFSLSNSHIFIDYGFNWAISRFELHFLGKLFSKIALGATIYVKTPQLTFDLFQYWKDDISLIHLDSIQYPTPRSIDVIIAFGHNHPSEFKERLSEIWQNRLKTNGILLLIFENENRRNETQSYYLIAESMEVNSRQDFLRQLGMRDLSSETKFIPLNNAEIRKILEQRCEKVKFLQIFGRYDVFLASEWKL